MCSKHTHFTFALGFRAQIPGNNKSLFFSPCFGLHLDVPQGPYEEKGWLGHVLYSSLGLLTVYFLNRIPVLIQHSPIEAYTKAVD